MFVTIRRPKDRSRAIANISNSACKEIVEDLIIAKPTIGNKKILALRDFQIKNNLWNKVLGAKDFEQFDEATYFRTLEIYSNEKDFSLITPTSIEEKMALIEVIQNRYAYYIGVPSLREELSTLNIKQMKKLISLMKKFDPTSQVTREDLENFSSELFIILKGPPVNLLEYFTENKTALMSKRLYRVVQEELLLKGLKNIINQFPEKVRYSYLEKAKLHINRIARYKLWRYTTLPLDLPFIDQVKLPDELLEKILLDGIDAHDEELIGIFRQNNMIDNYERFRKVYRTAAFATAFTFFYQDEQERRIREKREQAKLDEEKKQEFVKEFKKLSAIIVQSSSTKEKTDKELKDEQFNRSLIRFKAKYHEEPTTEEYTEMKKKIYGT